jgi:hypothetical protein
VGVLLAGPLTLRPRARGLVEGAEVLLDTTLPGAPDGRRAHLAGCSNLRVAQAVVGLEENAGAGALAGPRLAAPQELFSRRALFGASRHAVFFLGHIWSLLVTGVSRL